jgi:polyisoprenoid-binding protein YceI
MQGRDPGDRSYFRDHARRKLDQVSRKVVCNHCRKFDKWDAKLTFTSTDETTGVLEIKIEAASVDTGSGFKNGKLKSKDFFNVDENPFIHI